MFTLNVKVHFDLLGWYKQTAAAALVLLLLSLAVEHSVYLRLRFSRTQQMVEDNNGVRSTKVEHTIKIKVLKKSIRQRKTTKYLSGGRDEGIS